jgi:hypothetical protein
MSTARWSVDATLLPDGTVFVGDWNNSAAHELYNPATDSWSTAAVDPAVTSSNGSVLLGDGKVLVVGDSGGHQLSELYAPTTNSWSAGAASPPGAGSQIAATYTFLSDGKVLRAGGGSTGGTISELYHPAAASADSWSFAAVMPAPQRYRHTATLLSDGNVLVVGGVDADTFDPGYLQAMGSAELYHPSTDSWSSAGSMSTPRLSNTATRLADGTVLVTGGNTNTSIAVASAELYHPSTNSWSSAGSMSTARSSQSATLLPDGTVLVTGGRDATLTAVASAELYHPSTNSWSPAGSMATARSSQTATLLSDGRVLVAGGRDVNDKPLASAELYGASLPPVITGGPVGTVRVRTASFTFASTDSGVTFECRLDGAGTSGFSACSSPYMYSGLVDGVHTFFVRSVKNGAATAPAQQSWAVDTTPPVTMIESGPSEQVGDTAATFAFSSSEPGSSFECRLDAGSWDPCVSPKEYQGLNVGSHTFAVRATDAVGNQEPVGASRSWTVTEVCQLARDAPRALGGTHCVAPPPACATVKGSAPRGNEAGFGPFVAVAQSDAGCFSARGLDRVSSGPVTLNGIGLTFPHGGELVINRSRLVLYTTRAPRIDFRGHFSFQSPVPLVAPPGLNRSKYDLKFFFGNHVPDPPMLREGGLHPHLTPELEVSSDAGAFGSGNGGAARVKLDVELPPQFTAIHGTGGQLIGAKSTHGLGGSTEAVISNGNGFQWTGELRIPEVSILGQFTVRNLALRLSSEAATVSGSGELSLPSKLPGLSAPTVKLGVAIARNGLVGAEIALQTLNKPLAAGFFLQRLGVSVGRNTNFGASGPIRDPTFTGTAGVSFGPQLFGEEVAALDGAATFIFGDNALLQLSAKGHLLNMEIGRGAIQWSPFKSKIDFNGELTFAAFGYRVAAAIPKNQGWFDGAKDFSLRGQAQMTLPGLFVPGAADVGINQRGVMVCAGVLGQRVGFGFLWHGHVEGLRSGCDVARYETARGASDSRTAASSASAPVAITVRSGQRLATIIAVGQGAPPKVTLSGPHGEQITTPATAQGITNAGYLLFQDPQASTTNIALYNPAPGRWTLTTQPGSPLLVQVQHARDLPQPAITAAVKARGAILQLSWKTTWLPGQSVEFVERSIATSHVLTTTTAPSGRVQFTPEPGTDRMRTIQALVLQDGLPRQSLTVAHYTIQALPRPGKPTNLVARRHGASLRVTWGAARNANHYVLLTQTADAVLHSRLLPGTAHAMTIADGSTITGLALTALDQLNRPGPTNTIRIKLPKPSGR